MIDDVAVPSSLRCWTEPGEVWLAGEVDFSNAADLAAALGSASPRDDRIVVDLSAVSFVDLSATRELLWASARLQPPQHMSIRNAPPVLRTILERMEWLDDLDLHETGERP